jgi:DNA repair protein RadB
LLTWVNLQKIPTGCAVIDRFLGGGLPVESVALVYGEAETGKTTLAMQCAICNALHGYKTLFVDSDGTFSAERLYQIISEKEQAVVEQIILARPNDFREQSTMVDQLVHFLKKDFGLAVFDTATSLYRLRIAENSSKVFELNRELNRQLAVLAQTARIQKIAILLTSQVHSVMNENPITLEPVATRVLKFWSDTVIALKLAENPKGIQGTIEKNPSRLPPITFDLRIDGTGIHDCSTRRRGLTDGHHSTDR